MRDVNYGWLMRYIHMNGASMFFIVVYIHIFRGLYYGSYKAPRELLWMLGVVILLLMMATAFMGYVLPWGQMSFWGATVITNLFSAIPLVGQTIVTWLWGGFCGRQPDAQPFLLAALSLPFVIVGVVMLHLGAAPDGSNNPLGIDRRAPQDTIPFHPYYTIKDVFGLGVFLIIYALVVFFARTCSASRTTISRPTRCRRRRDRARMVFPAVLRDPALGPEYSFHPRKAGGRPLHVRLDRRCSSSCPGSRPRGAQRAFPSDLQAVPSGC